MTAEKWEPMLADGEQFREPKSARPWVVGKRCGGPHPVIHGNASHESPIYYKTEESAQRAADKLNEGRMMKLNERNTTKPAREQGLFRKFDVRRTDGRDQPGGDKEGAEYFVLDLTNDPHANAALRTYADAVEVEYPALAADLRARADASRFA